MHFRMPIITMRRGEPPRHNLNPLPRGPTQKPTMLHQLNSLAELAESTFLKDAIAQAISVILSGRTIRSNVYRALEGMVFAELANTEMVR